MRISALSNILKQNFSFLVTSHWLFLCDNRELVNSVGREVLVGPLPLAGGIYPMDSFTPALLHPGDSMACPFDDMNLQVWIQKISREKLASKYKSLGIHYLSLKDDEAI